MAARGIIAGRAGTTSKLWCRYRRRTGVERRAGHPILSNERCLPGVVVMTIRIVLARRPPARCEDLGNVATRRSSRRGALRVCRPTPISIGADRSCDARHDGTELAKQSGTNDGAAVVILPPVMPECGGELDAGVPRLLKPYRQQDLAAW